MADTQDVKSKREQQIERLRARYPEKRFEDEDEIYGTIYDDYDQYEQELGELKGREQTLSDMFAADPRSAQFLTDMHKGEDPVLGLVRNFGVEIKDYLEDPEMQEEIEEANREYIERVARNKELEAEWKANEEETKETLRRFQEEKGLSDEEIDALFAKALGIVNDGVMFKYTYETLEMVSKAMNYDTDVATASEEGEIAGRNARITEQLRRPKQGDGTNPIGGRNGEGERPRRGQSIFDLAGEAM